MTTLPVRSTPPAQRRVQLVAAIAILAAVLAQASRVVLPTLPPRVDYTVGYAPWWIALIAAGLATGALLAHHGSLPRRVVLGTGWAAAVLLLWSSAGVVLDGFRAFFAITGIPAGDFAIVDVPGFIARALSLAAAAAVVVATVRLQPRSSDPDRTAPRGPVRAGHAALVLIWPYPLLKVHWWLGGTFARPEAEISAGMPVGEVSALVVGFLLALALTMPWGRRLPRWLVLTAGWLVSGVLLSTGALAVFGTLSQLVGLTDGPVPTDTGSVLMVSAVYGSWLLLGVAFTLATWTFQQDTRRRPVTDGPRAD